MHYENRQPPEGINVETRGWLWDFVLLVTGSALALVVVCWLLLQAVAWSAKWVPFSWEQALTRAWTVPERPDERLQYLQDLARSLAHAGDLNPDLSIILRYSENSQINAFATLGGNVVIFEGLLDAVESEQGLAFVIAHELAHVHYRHPAQALGRGMSLGLMTALILGQTDLSQIAGLGGHLAMLSYSRRQEAQADRWALNALFHHYGHVNGADELFRHLSETDLPGAGQRIPQWLASHPDLSERLRNLQHWARERGYPEQGESKALPSFLRSLPDHKD